MAKKILIAEDEKPLANALKLKLTKAGFEAVAVFDGLAAIDLLKKEPFDLMILDLIMPKADGFQVLAALKENKISTPVIVLSNLSQPGDEKKSREFGARDFFIKSDTSLAVLLSHVEKILHS